MRQYHVFLGLGANVGDRAGFLRNAAGMIRRVPDLNVIWFSSVYETEPVGKTAQASFLNAVAEVQTTLLPRDLLVTLKEIERRVGRIHREVWGPRELDIDILIYDGLVQADEIVTVPHPYLSERRFVLIPLREIAPDLVHPINGMTVEEMAGACQDRSRVVKTSHRIGA